MEKEQKKKKKRVNSKSKGSGYEASIAKKLSTALAPLNFIRTQGSGARVGGKNFHTVGQMFGEDALKLFVGDVVPVNERQTGITFKHSVETKFYKTPDSFPALVSGNANIFGWMNEAILDAAKIDRLPMLIFKWNNINSMVGTLQETPCTRLVISLPDRKPIFVSYLDELLLHPNFWIENVSGQQIHPMV